MNEQGDPIHHHNNRLTGVVPDGDANANQIQSENGERTIDTVTLSQTEEQNKIIIWGTDSQCDDPELAEFEMLECQELEAYLVEEGQDFGMSGPGPLSYSPSVVGPTPHKNTSTEENQTIQSGISEKEAPPIHVSKSRGVAEVGTRVEFSSETDIFVACLSTMSSLGGSLASALDMAGRTHTTDPSHVPSGPYRTLSEDLTLVSQSHTILSNQSRCSQLTDNHNVSSRENTSTRNNVDLNQNSSVMTKKEIVQAKVDNGVDMEHMEEVNEEHNHNIEHKCKLKNAVLSGRNHTAEDNAEKTVYVSPTEYKEEGRKMSHMSSQTETSDMNHNPPKSIKKQGSFDKTLPNPVSFDKSLKKQASFETTLKKHGCHNTMKKQCTSERILKKQGSFENSCSSSPSSLERRKPWGSPNRSPTPLSPRWTPSGSPVKASPSRTSTQKPSDSPQRGVSALKQPTKVCLTSGIPKPAPSYQKELDIQKSSPPQKPKNVRPKIITSVRKSSQLQPEVTDGPQKGSVPLPRFSSYPSPSSHKKSKAEPQPKSSSVLCSSNLMYDKYRQEMQKACYFPSSMPGSGKPPSHTFPLKLSGKSVSFHGERSDAYPLELPPYETASLYRSPKALRPQLGLGAVTTRQPSAKTRMLQPAEQIWPGSETTPKSLLPNQSGLRPPGFSTLPAAQLAALGIVCSASASSVSSNQSSDSNHSDRCQPSQRPRSGSDVYCATVPPKEAHWANSRSSPQPPTAPALQRRSLLLPPRGAAQTSRKESQRDAEMVRPIVSSPKRFAVVSPKPQSPVHHRRPAGTGGGVTQEAERVLVQKLREQCQEQTQQLQNLKIQLKKATMGLEVFAITTQHFCQKSESAVVKERELYLNLARIRDEVAFSVSCWERLQKEKEELELCLERQLQGLQEQQHRELRSLEQSLRDQHTAETKNLQAQQHAQLDQLRGLQREQMDKMNEDHEAALVEMETAHNDTLATLKEEHARTVKNLKMAHEQQRRSLEEDFEKLRLSLQDQVDTLTFQNRSLRDRAKRFEEALRRSTDEQIVDALAPYQHIEDDLKSLKEVLEMKNQQIHEQDLKISELEKMAQKNVFLEERVQVLQQQNEDLKARIDNNLAMSRQLSEENANLQVHVEKESNEKKRLSRTNEELLWRLQTGELSPRMSPTSSPIHRASSGPGSPARPHPGSPARPHSFHQ